MSILRVWGSEVEISSVVHGGLILSALALAGNALSRELRRGAHAYAERDDAALLSLGSSSAGAEKAESGEGEDGRNDDDDWQRGGGASCFVASRALLVGSSVLHPSLGRGIVEAVPAMRIKTSANSSGVVHVHYNADPPGVITETRASELLQVGSSISHTDRGHGVIRGFDDADRVHVEFQNGEYHRYKTQRGAGLAEKLAPRKGAHLSRNEDKSWWRKIPNRRFMVEYARYRLDYALSSYSLTKPFFLLVSTYTLIIVGAAFYAMVSGLPYIEAIWIAWTYVADPGTHSDEKGTLNRLIGMCLTVGGMLVFALIIGIIADYVSDFVDGLKQGHSAVIESGHSLILGYSDKILPLIRELALANESEGGGVIVILADHPKEEMENTIKRELSPQQARGTLIVCRSGSPLNRQDLLKVSAGSARSVVVLADPRLAPDVSDASALRIVMSLSRIRGPTMGHVVVEMCDIDNRDLLYLVDPHNVEVVVAHDLIGRLMIQGAREPGLTEILDEILGFEGDEFYITHFNELEGKTFGEIQFMFPAAIPIGVKPIDRSDAYKQILNSPWRIEALNRRSVDGAVAKSPRNGGSGENAPTLNSSFRSTGSRTPTGTPATIPENLQSESAPGSPSQNPASDQPPMSPPAFALRGGGSVTHIVDHFSEPVGEVFDSSETELSREVILNPPDDYIFRKGDHVLVLAEDNDSFEPCELSTQARAAYESLQPAHRPVVINKAEKLLMCGWRRDMDDMIVELDALVGAGSELTIMSTLPVAQRLERIREGGLDVSRLRNLTISHHVGSPISRRELKSLKLHTFSSVLILADEALEDSISTSDSRVLASLLLIRDLIAKANQGFGGQTLAAAAGMGGGGPGSPLTPAMFERSSSSNMSSRALFAASKFGSGSSMRLTEASPNWQSGPKSPRAEDGPFPGVVARVASGRNWRPSLVARRPSNVGADIFFQNGKDVGRTVIIAEVLHAETKALISRVGDHIMSNAIVAASLAMVSEDRLVNCVLSELLQAEGNKIHLRSSLDIGVSGEKVTFWEIMARCRARAEVAIGYRHPNDKTFTLNPRDKDAVVGLGARTVLVVIAED